VLCGAGGTAPRQYGVVVLDDGAVELTREQIVAHDDQRDLGPAGDTALAAAYSQVFDGARVLLDAGGGSGSAAPALRASGSSVVIADWSFSMLAAARHRADLRCAADLRCLPFRDAAFDGVHAAFAIQNVSDWRRAIAECVRVAQRDAPVVVAWGGPLEDDRLTGIETAFFGALGHAAGVRAQGTGITLRAANDCFAELGKPLQGTFTVKGTQTRTPRQIAERARLNPYRASADPGDREEAVKAALSWAAAHVGPVDHPVSFRVAKVHHTYRSAAGQAPCAPPEKCR